MSEENLKEFCRLVLQDLQLQNHLKSLTDRDEFVLKVVEIGASFGFEITNEDIERQLRENRRQWHERWM